MTLYYHPATPILIIAIASVTSINAFLPAVSQSYSRERRRHHSIKRQQKQPYGWCNRGAHSLDVTDPCATPATTASTTVLCPPSYAPLLERVDSLISTLRKTENDDDCGGEKENDTMIDSLLQTVDQQHINDLQMCASILLPEETDTTVFVNKQDGRSANGNAKGTKEGQRPSTPSYEWIYAAPPPTETDKEGRPRRTLLSSSSLPYPIAIRTTSRNGEGPILTPKEVETIRNAGLAFWERARQRWGKAEKNDSGVEAAEGNGNPSGSRFTYQRKGNYEVHLTDLILEDDKNGERGGIDAIVNRALREKIYPLVRDAFYSEENRSMRQRPFNNNGGVGQEDALFLEEDQEPVKLCVYDSLLICYNSTEATNNSKSSSSSSLLPSKPSGGAGQPLHRDKALFSVNIMMNPSSDFQGGGTFFENQLRSVPRTHLSSFFSGRETYRVEPLRSNGVGHALIHRSDERHAGAATTEGERFVLVFFLSGTTTTTTTTKTDNDTVSDTDSIFQTPERERTSRLKSLSPTTTSTTPSSSSKYRNDHYQQQQHPSIQRVLLRLFTVHQAPYDGEAWHYLGTALHDLGPVISDDNGRKKEASILAVECLERARRLLPCDGRLCNNLGLALERLRSCLLHYYHLSVGVASGGVASGNGGVEEEKTKIKDVKHRRIVQAYERSMEIHAVSEIAGCDIGSDIDATCLNYGLYLANQDEFGDAVEVLRRRFDGKSYDGDDAGEGQRRRAGDVVVVVDVATEQWRVREDGRNLLSFCKRQLE